MSDLAPFVATVLKDRAVVEMMAELKKLRKLVDDRLKIQITGKKGAPIYREGSLKDGHSSHRGRCFEVIFNDDDDDGSSNESKGVVPLSALGDLELHMAGTVVQKLGNAQTIIGSCNAPFFTSDHFYREPKHNLPNFLDTHRKEIVFKIKNKRRGSPVPFVIARFGDETDCSLEYAKLRDLSMAGLQNLKVSTIVVEGLAFSKTEIKESLSVLEAIGCNVDEGNSHRDYVHAVDETRSPMRKKQKCSSHNSSSSSILPGGDARIPSDGLP